MAGQQTTAQDRHFIGKANKVGKMLLLCCFETPLLSLEAVCEHLFAGMSLKVMKAKLESGEIPLPVVQFGAGQKGPGMLLSKTLPTTLTTAAEKRPRSSNGRFSITVFRPRPVFCTTKKHRRA